MIWRGSDLIALRTRKFTLDFPGAWIYSQTLLCSSVQTILNPYGKIGECHECDVIATMNRYAPTLLTAVVMLLLESGHGIRCYVGERHFHELRDCGADVHDCLVTIRHSTSGKSLPYHITQVKFSCSTFVWSSFTCWVQKCVTPRFYIIFLAIRWQLASVRHRSHYGVKSIDFTL